MRNIKKVQKQETREKEEAEKRSRCICMVQRINFFFMWSIQAAHIKYKGGKGVNKNENT